MYVPGTSTLHNHVASLYHCLIIIISAYATWPLSQGGIYSLVLFWCCVLLYYCVGGDGGQSQHLLSLGRLKHLVRTFYF